MNQESAEICQKLKKWNQIHHKQIEHIQQPILISNPKRNKSFEADLRNYQPQLPKKIKHQNKQNINTNRPYFDQASDVNKKIDYKNIRAKIDTGLKKEIRLPQQNVLKNIFCNFEAHRLDKFPSCRFDQLKIKINEELKQSIIPDCLKQNQGTVQSIQQCQVFFKEQLDNLDQDRKMDLALPIQLSEKKNYQQVQNYLQNWEQGELKTKKKTQKKGMRRSLRMIEKKYGVVKDQMHKKKIMQRLKQNGEIDCFLSRYGDGPVSQYLKKLLQNQ